MTEDKKTNDDGSELLAKVLPGGVPLLGYKPGYSPVYDGFGRLLGYVKYANKPKKPDQASGLGTFDAEL